MNLVTVRRSKIQEEAPVGEGTAWWFGATGFEVLATSQGEVEVQIDVQSTATIVGCAGCGVRATPKDRRWVTVRDAPAGNVAVVVRWRKRIWVCKDPDCPVKTWTEQANWVGPRQSLSAAAQRWATDRVQAVEATPASIAGQFGVAWSTVWAAVERTARGRVDDAGRVGPTAMVGFDETVMQPASRRRRRRFVTAVVDVASGQILDVFEGHDAQHLRAWMAAMPPAWLAHIDVVSVDPHEGYRSALTNPHPVTGAPSPLADTLMVVDPFHIVRLANAAVTSCRARIQRETLEHRGWKGDPLYDVRKLLLMAAERVDERGWERIHAALDAGDPNDVLAATWTGKEKVRNIYLTDDLHEATAALDDAIDWCTDPQSGPELTRLLKTLRRWRTEILNHHRTGASNGPVEAANLLIKQIKRSGRGFRNIDNYRLRILLAGGTNPLRETHQVTRLRPRRPRLVA
jgi:transposase